MATRGYVVGPRGGVRTAQPLRDLQRRGPQGGNIAFRLDTRDVYRMADVLADAAEQAPHAVARALNRTATETRTAMGRALVDQTGLPYGTVRRALSMTRASRAFLVATIVARGSYLPLKAFRARATRKGVSAAPWNRRRVFKGTFFIAAYSGNVYRRTGRKRFPIKKLYGPAIPIEFVKDNTAATFHLTVPRVLVRRLDHELGRLL